MSFKELLERKFNVIIEWETEKDKEWCVAYYRTSKGKGKEICRERDLGELQLTLKLYLS